MNKTFKHIEVELPKLERETIDGVRYYKVPDEEGVTKLVSITSVTSHFNKHIFVDWRKRVGEEKANAITKNSTTRGTYMHLITEHYLKNSLTENYIDDLNIEESFKEISDELFETAKPELDNIDNIYSLEGSLYSILLGIAGTVDCIAEYKGELAIIDFKTSEKEKRRDWIDHYFVQAAAYAVMFYELTKIPVKKLVIIMACANGKCVVFEEYNIKKYVNLLVKYIKKFVNDKVKEYEDRK